MCAVSGLLPFFTRHSRESGYPVTCVMASGRGQRHWVPAFAGMTARRFAASLAALALAFGGNAFAQDPGSDPGQAVLIRNARSEEHTSELQSLMRNSYAVFCLKKKNNKNTDIIMMKRTKKTKSKLVYDVQRTYNKTIDTNSSTLAGLYTTITE